MHPNRFGVVVRSAARLEGSAFAVHRVPRGLRHSATANGRKYRPRSPVGTLPFDRGHWPAPRRPIPRLAIGQRRQAAAIAQVWDADRGPGYPRLQRVGHKRPRPSEVRPCSIDSYRTSGLRAVREIDAAMVRRSARQDSKSRPAHQYLILLKRVLSFARSRGLAATYPIDCRTDKRRHVQTFLDPRNCGRSTTTASTS